MAEAVAEIRHAVELLPKRTIFRINLVPLYRLAGEFQMAEREARTALELDPENPRLGLLALGAAQEGLGS
jgi:Flp pilus assembly protein TadD